MVTTPVLALVVSFFSNAELWLRLATLAVGVAVGILGLLNQCYIWRHRKRIRVNVEVPEP